MTPAPPVACPVVRRAGVWAALTVAVLAMSGLHLVQLELSPWHEPVSFYVHGPHGWLFTVALASFGAAAVLLGGSWRHDTGTRGRWALLLFGTAMLIVAVVPSDPFFPWEADPSGSGLVHAGLSVVAPPLLLWPMWRRRAAASPLGRRWAGFNRWVYGVSLVASGASLLVGWLHGGPPPAIGVAERVLAWAAVGWMAWAAA